VASDGTHDGLTLTSRHVPFRYFIVTSRDEDGRGLIWRGFVVVRDVDAMDRREVGVPPDLYQEQEAEVPEGNEATVGADDQTVGRLAKQNRKYFGKKYPFIQNIQVSNIHSVGIFQ
jgi:hypothetical protein